MHLIGLALHEETRQRKMGKSFGFVSAATERHHHGQYIHLKTTYTHKCTHITTMVNSTLDLNTVSVPKHRSLFQCLDALQGEQIVQPYSGFLVWTIQVCRIFQSLPKVSILC